MTTVTGPPRGIVCFDLDGTLLRHTSVSQFLAESFGHGAALAALEERFRNGEISNAAIADGSARWFTGWRRQDIWTLLEAAPWIAGIGAAVERLRAEGFLLVVGTITWRFAAEMLQARYAIDAVSGTEMQEVDGRLTGSVSRYFDEHDKLDFVAKFCAERGCSLIDCVAVGDSRSDVPLFRHVGLAIALNASPDARAAAHHVVDADDLAAVLPAIVTRRGLRVRSPGSSGPSDAA